MSTGPPTPWAGGITLPINRRLLSGAVADHTAVAGALLARWGRLHAVRTVVTVVAAVFLLA